MIPISKVIYGKVLVGSATFHFKIYQNFVLGKNFPNFVSLNLKVYNGPIISLMVGAAWGVAGSYVLVFLSIREDNLYEIRQN